MYLSYKKPKINLKHPLAIDERFPTTKVRYLSSKVLPICLKFPIKANPDDKVKENIDNNAINNGFFKWYI